MAHNDEAFATMLLMCQLSAEKEELVRPLSITDFYRMRNIVREAGLPGMRALLGMDMSAMRARLQLPEEECYRLCVLMGRVIPLSYAIEKYIDAGIDIVTLEDSAYPACLRDRLGEKAAPILYACGNLELAQKPSLGILGTSARVGEDLLCDELTPRAVHAGLAIVSGGEIGFARRVERFCADNGGSFITFLAESMLDRIYQPVIGEMIASGRALALSAIHPDARYTAAHALARNKYLYALSDATVMACVRSEQSTLFDGALSALRNRYCEEMYAWNNPDLPGNRALIDRGFKAFSQVDELPLGAIAQRRLTPGYEQLSFF